MAVKLNEDANVSASAPKTFRTHSQAFYPAHSYYSLSAEVTNTHSSYPITQVISQALSIRLISMYYLNVFVV